MLYDEGKVDVCFLMKELVSSLRDVNVRIQELKSLLLNGLLSDEGEKEVRIRLERMIHTKFSLIYSIYDIRKDFLLKVGNPSADKTFSMENIRKEI